MYIKQFFVCTLLIWKFFSKIANLVFELYATIQIHPKTNIPIHRIGLKN